MSNKTDIDRILAIPSSSPAPDVTDLYRRPNGKMRLRAAQSQALHDAVLAKGGLYPIGVGWGKTLISQLIGVALKAKRPLVLLPAPCEAQFWRDYQTYGKNFTVHPNLQVLTYSKLQVASGRDALKTIQPDLIIADEAHNLRNLRSARCQRVHRYLKTQHDAGNPVMFVCLSGTLTTKGLRDYAHLAKWSLRSNAPVPRDPNEVIAWSMVLDSGTNPKPEELSHIAPLVRHYMPGVSVTQEAARAAFADRFTSTLGVVATKDSSAIGCSLILSERKVAVPQVIEDALKHVSSTWSLPSGDQEFSDPMALAGANKQIAQGFYYKWDWGSGRPNEADKEWIEMRKRWARAVRAQIAREVDGLDSELLITNACRWSVKNNKLYPGLLGMVAVAWQIWEPFHKIKPPPTVAVWLDDFLIRDAVAWAAEQKEPVIIWYGDTAVGSALAKAGLPVYGQGTEMPLTAVTCAASYNVHGTGKNLQPWRNQILLDPPSSGQTWEQLLGRTHRQGQTADEVLFSYYKHTREFTNAIEKAKQSAAYIEATTNTPQRLIYATWD
jgi:hypothetical protein